MVDSWYDLSWVRTGRLSLAHGPMVTSGGLVLIAGPRRNNFLLLA
jgi:hypothetical protein